MAKYSGRGGNPAPPSYGYQKYAADQPYDRPPAADIGVVLNVGFNPPPEKKILDRTMRPFDDDW